MARTGLRMMPTFPSPPLKFRTAGFPRYGFKAGYQTTPSPTHRFAIVLRALCFHQNSLLGVRDDALMSTSARANFRSTPGALAPVRVILSQSIVTYRPHPPHSQAHPDFAAVRLIRDALAVLLRLGDPRVVPCFHCLFLLDMPSSATPGVHRFLKPSPLTDGVGLRLA
jgi:hypothetical protein